MDGIGFFAALVAVTAVLLAAALAIDVRSFLPFREHPDRLLGTKLRFRGVEGGPPPAEYALPDASVRGFRSGEYLVAFERPFAAGGSEINVARISSRYSGRPLSRVGMQRAVTVNGVTDGGFSFIAEVIRA